MKTDLYKTKKLIVAPENIRDNTCCFAVAEKAIVDARWNYDDILYILEKENNHKWGSNADRKQRKQDINKVIDFVCLNVNLFL